MSHLLSLRAINPFIFSFLFYSEFIWNPVAGYTGSFTRSKLELISLDCCECRAEVKWKLENDSGALSVTHFPWFNGQYLHILENNPFGENSWLSTTTQIYEFTEVYNVCERPQDPRYLHDPLLLYLSNTLIWSSSLGPILP